jgi:hypothetical protein
MYQRDPADRRQNVIDEEEGFHQPAYARQNRSISHWLKKLGEPSIIAVLLVLIATGGLLWATSSLVTEAKRSSEEATRAWISPTAASLMSKTESGKPINIGLAYNNVGRAPATDINMRYALYVFPNEAVDSGKAMATIAEKDPCEGVEPVNGAAAVYPGPTGARLILALTPTDQNGQHIQLYDTYMSGNHTLAAHFCIAYHTFGATHKSAFCYFYRPDRAAGMAFNQCSQGHHAD